MPASPVACQVAVWWAVPWPAGCKVPPPLWQAGKFSGMECSPDTRQGESSVGRLAVVPGEKP